MLPPSSTSPAASQLGVWEGPSLPEDMPFEREDDNSLHLLLQSSLPPRAPCEPPHRPVVKGLAAERLNEVCRLGELKLTHLLTLAMALCSGQRALDKPKSSCVLT